MKKSTQLWTILFAFVFGQLIQLVTNAMAHYLFVSDPVMMCITVAIVTVALVIMTAVFTLMGDDVQSAHVTRPKSGGAHNVVLPVGIFGKRPPLDTDPEDIDEIDKNNSMEALK